MPVSTLQRNLLVLVVVALLLGVAGYFIYPPSESTRLGLDLQGGLSVLLEAKDSPQAPRTEESLEQAITIMQERVNRLGVTEPEIQRQGEWKISVQLPGIDDPEKAVEVIGKTAVLEFYDVQQFGQSFLSQEEALAAAGVESEDELPPGQRLLVWPAEGEGVTDRWYLVEEEPLMTGSALESAAVGIDQNNQPKVDMEFTGEGAQQFAEITGTLAQRAQVTGQDQLLAIVLDGVIQSAPRVQERISGGRAEITGRFSLEEAENLALVLQTGALPVELEIVEERQVGATLGKASLEKALYAGGLGLVLVFVFMVAFYRLLGVVADIALVTFGILFWGTLNAIGATLTLPGIAGAILTLGMAVDANIIIFARVREEVAAGKSIRTAVDSGFRKALKTILDANVTTVITAAILFWAATGGVRGFALTLGIGVTLSMFTAIVVTRSMLYILGGWRPFRNRALLGLPKPTTERAG
ncbi:MAG: protein translocase subunit SecD [Thermoleophilia bacterium]